MSKSKFTRGCTVVVALILSAVAVFEPVGGRPISAQAAQEAARSSYAAAAQGTIAYVQTSTQDIHTISPDGAGDRLLWTNPGLSGPTA